jgi:hypothetical protein
VEGVARAAAVPEGVLLDTAATSVEGAASDADDMEGIQDRYRVGKVLIGGGLEPGEPALRKSTVVAGL